MLQDILPDDVERILYLDVDIIISGSLLEFYYEDFEGKLRSLGAVCITYPHVAEMIADILGESFYILPSSIHEVIIVPESRSLGFKAFATVISEINMTQIEEEEVLTDHAYYYDKEHGIIFYGGEWREC